MASSAGIWQSHRLRLGITLAAMLVSGIATASCRYVAPKPGPEEESVLASAPTQRYTMSPTDVPSPAEPTPTGAATRLPSPSLAPSGTATYPPAAALATRTLAPSPSGTAMATPTAISTPTHRPATADPTHITIPAIGVNAPVITVGIVERSENGRTVWEWEVADYAAGFHQSSARPGQLGNTVISGHNNLKGEVFRDLHKLQAGDDVYLWAGDVSYRYHVSVVHRLREKGVSLEEQAENVRWIMPTDDERLTLVSCWPYWTYTHRIIVVAYPVLEAKGP